MLNKLFNAPKGLIILFVILISHTSFSQKKYDAEVLNKETTIEVKDNKLVKKHFYAIRINNRSGDSYAEISIPFNKMIPISDLQAYITDNTGVKVKSLKKNEITVLSASTESSFYSDMYVKEFTLRNNTYPYTLIYSYQEETAQFFILDHWSPVIDTRIPTLQAKLTIITPKDYTINYSGNKIENPSIDTLAEQLVYHWQARYTHIITPEIGSPSVWQFIPYIYVVPIHFVYETEGFQNSWKSFGNWNLSLLNGLNELPSSELLVIHRLTDNIRDTTEKIRALFHYLQSNTRYINVSIKTGGMKPYPASYVAENKYGDCKALSNYFKACLASLGIKAHYTTINAGEVIESIDTTFPSQQFNHVIVFVPMQNDTLWVDCTSDLAFGYLGTFTQNRPALVLSDNNSSLIPTPALSFDDVLQNRSIKALINTDNSLQCEFSETYRGYQYEMLSGIKSEYSESQRKIILSRYLVETGFEMEKYAILATGIDSPEIGLNYTASSKQYVKVYGDESLLKVIPMETFVPEDPKMRKLPLQFNYPIYQVDTIEYAIPEKFAVSALPENIKTESKYGGYQVSFSQKNKMARIVKELKINACTVSPEEYPAFYAFYNGILDSDKSLYITLTRK